MSIFLKMSSQILYLLFHFTSLANVANVQRTDGNFAPHSRGKAQKLKRRESEKCNLTQSKKRK